MSMMMGAKAVMCSLVTAILAEGCASSGPVLGVAPVAFNELSAVDQRHYPGVVVGAARDKVIEALQGLAFQVDATNTHRAHGEEVIAIHSHRDDVARVLVTLEPLGGRETLVTVEVAPPDPLLAAEIHRELARRLAV